MEAIISSHAENTDVLPDSIRFKLDETASFVLARRESVAYALGCSYSPDGVKVIQISYGSTTEWLDPSSVVFSALFTNTGTAPAYPSTPDANCIFSRIEVKLGSTSVEVLEDSHRMNQLFTLLTMSPAKRDNLAMLGFGAQPGDISIAANHKAVHIPAGATKRIFWKVNLSGLLNNPKLDTVICPVWHGTTVDFHAGSSR